MNLKILGLVLNLIGTIFFGIGALDNSSPTWDDVGNKSKKSNIINILARIGLILVVIGFAVQIIELYL